MGLDIVQNVLAGNLIEGIPEVQLEKSMVNLQLLPLDTWYAPLPLPTCYAASTHTCTCAGQKCAGQKCSRPISRTSAMRYLAVSRRKYRQLQWGVHRPLALAARGGWHQQRWQQKQGKPGLSKQPSHRGQVLEKGTNQLLQLQWPHTSAARATQKVQGQFQRGTTARPWPPHQAPFMFKRQILHRAGTRLRVGRVQAAKGLDCCWRVRAKARWQKGCTSLSVEPFFARLMAISCRWVTERSCRRGPKTLPRVSQSDWRSPACQRRSLS